MGTVTVRRVDDEVMRDLRISAARRGVSMEQEARDRLRRPLAEGRTGAAEARDDAKWNLQASIEQILGIGKRLPHVELDQKEETDKLYRYLDDKG